MKKIRIKIDPLMHDASPGRVDLAKVDATTEQDIMAQQAIDERSAQLDAARYVRRVRKRMGLTQAEFAERIQVPLDTIRHWEHGQRMPTGAAKALLKVLDHAPEIALIALP